MTDLHLSGTSVDQVDTNRLINEKSPYLQQHAHNPVDWYPWGEEAFEAARREKKPIFLSIGYSTCHWCHVMEQESFEDQDVARMMNDVFISIKVDREERPDIDQIYMLVCQMITGSGGWPLTIIMTPEKQPFFAGTYFPKEDRHNRLGMLSLIPKIAELWSQRQADIYQDARKIARALAQRATVNPGDDLGEETLELAIQQLAGRYDPVNGGFGERPKFPSPHNFLFLLRYWHRTQNSSALRMVENTLQKMRSGGIYDHIGFGFHRYSTDERWLLPHFEKMLYDQAMLALAYLESYQATENQKYAETAEEIFTYVLRDMTSPEGGFYSAEDADSEGEEGKFYLWSVDELKDILTGEDVQFVVDNFNMTDAGNFSGEASGRTTGKNIPHLGSSLVDQARERGEDPAMISGRWDSIRQKMFDYRERRVHPHKDDKILTDWNGLMIAAMARGGRILQKKTYTDAAERAARFLLGTLRDDRGRLLHRFRNGEAAIPAHVDDYAFFIWGLIELYEATFDSFYLETALQLNSDFTDHFWDQDQGIFYFTADDSEELLVRSVESYDGAIPSGNSVAAMNLLRLGRITANPRFEDRARAIGRASGKTVEQAATGFTQLLCAVDFALGPSFEVVITGQLHKADTQAMVNALFDRYLPNKVVIFRPSTDGALISKLAPYTVNQRALQDKATAYVCQNYACQAPTTEIGEMIRTLEFKERF